ncbi:unnamed protein product [Vitrella brassicaformis CCMP3155]|uniref:Uncharacterized protein n=2 Tax=Vitrella brassicaformis TaxID=1169539 RepID=A0A0G4EPM9_VITBC|nr:unnamed protein product [Vitrella brassicaformis CCMP3155]|eukprot:CEL99516.1 unnamed protein product [Vitrella brassicaformis CCMP3155]
MLRGDMLIRFGCYLGLCAEAFIPTRVPIHRLSSLGASSSADPSSKTSRRSVLNRVLLLSPFIGASLPRSPSAIAEEPPKLDVRTVAETVRRDFLQGQYYVTGDLTPSIYAKDCIFIDPTVTVQGVDTYVRAVRNLFDPATSQADLLGLEVLDDSHIRVEWRLGGSLKLPWKPVVKPYTGRTLYTLNDRGLIVRHEEEWDISAAQAFLSTFIPAF